MSDTFKKLQKQRARNVDLYHDNRALHEELRHARKVIKLLLKDPYDPRVRELARRLLEPGGY